MDVLRTFPGAPYGKDTANNDSGASASSYHALLAQALTSLRAGQYAEGMTLLVNIRDWLPPELLSLTPVLNTIIQGYSEYIQAQEELLAASKHFAQIDSEQRTRLLPLEQYLLQEKEQREQGANALPPPTTQAYTAHNHIGHLSHDTQARQPAKQEIVQLEAYRTTGNQADRHNASSNLPPLYIVCFGHFQVLRGNEPLALCQNRNGQVILRYLVTQTNHRASADMLMEICWPDDEPEVARRKLQVAVSALRRSLNSGYDCDAGGGYVLCQKQYYQINSAVTITSDKDEFFALYEQGRQSSDSETTMNCYEQACRLYTGLYLVEDTYADWSYSQREQCILAHSVMCNTLAEHALATGNYDRAIEQANLVLAENRCDETAYRLLMQSYAAQGRRSEAIRQYHRCEQVLREELGVVPMHETTQLFHSILTRKP